MIFLGPAGTPTVSKTIEDGVKKVAELGLHTIEVQFGRGVRMTPERAELLGKLAEEHNIRLSAHAPYFINLNSLKQETIENSKAQILKTAEVADAMNAYIVTVHAGYYSGKSSAAATAEIKRHVVECADKIKERGWNILIGLETMGKSRSWGTLEEIAEVCRERANVVPVIDFAHIHARANGCLRGAADFEAVLREYEKIYTRFLHAHFTCVAYGDKGEKYHLTLDAQDPDFAVLAEVLKRKSYDIIIISESPVLEQDSLVMKEILAEH
jgi:deoxyribonuclease-4